MASATYDGALPRQSPSRSAPLGVLPGLGGSLSELARYGQLGRLLDYYVPAWLERFGRVRFFSFEPERIEQHTEDLELRRRVEVIAPRLRIDRRRRAIGLGLGRESVHVRSCALIRALQAPGAVVPLLAQAPFVCTYGYSYSRLTSVRIGGAVGAVALPAKQAFIRKTLSMILRRASATIVTSPSGADEARALGAARIELVPNGVDLAVFAPREEAKEFDAVFVGRLSPEKDVARLIDAAAAVPGIRVALVGDGPLRTELAGRAAARGVDVVLLGAQPHDRLPAILTRSRCFVLPSPYEGQPKALLEAMACGLPCIAADIPGVTELSPDGAVALFEPKRTAALASTLNRVLSDDAFARDLGRKARVAVLERYDLHVLLRREIELLDDVARERIA